MLSPNRFPQPEVNSASPLAPPAPGVNVLEVALRHKWVLVVAPIIALGIGLIYLKNAEKSYSSNSRLYVQQNGLRILSESESVTTKTSNFLTTQCELIRSTPILAHVADHVDLQSLETFKGIDNPVAGIQTGLTVTSQANADIINVSFRSSSASDSVQIVNGIVAAYIDYQDKQRKSSAAEVLKILQKEKDKRDTELAANQKAVLDFRRENGILSFESKDGNIVTQRLAALSTAMTTAEFDAIDAKALYESALKLKDDPARLKQLAESQTKSVVVNLGEDSNELAQQRRELERRIASLRRQYGDEWKAVREAKADLEALRADMASFDKPLADSYLSLLSQKVVLTESRKAELLARYDAQRDLAMDLNSKSAEYSKLDSDGKRLERLCDILDNRIKEINVTEDGNVLNASILEVAKGSLLDWPRRDRILGSSLLGGLMLGLAFALGLDFLDQRMRSVDEIRNLLDRSVLGVIPRISARESVQQRGRKTFLEPMSDVAEAYRTLRTAVYFADGMLTAKKLLVTSPAPGDGKTTSASNLAIAIAQAGHRVLLVDADFRRPMLHRVYSVASKVGMTSVLSGQVGIEKAILKTEIESLDLLPAGPIPANPAEILNSAAFSDLLDKLGSKYDHVVIDSPPVAPVTDARILGAICDATILVLRAEKSTRKMSLHAVDSLTSVGAQILGVVVNDIPRGRGRYGYYSEYGYYQYGYGRDNANGKGKSTKRARKTFDAEAVLTDKLETE